MECHFKLHAINANSAGRRDFPYQRNDLSGLGGEFVRQLLIVGNQVGNVNIAVVLLDEDILS